jgi:hypothetical protein
MTEARPHVVEVDAGGHHADGDLEGAGLRDVDLLELHGLDRLAEALLADHPGGHRGRQLTGFDVQLCDLADINGHVGRPPLRF